MSKSVNKGGRPREYDRDEIEQWLIEWALKDDSVSMTGFSAEYWVDPDTVLRFSKSDPGFLRTYNLVRSLIATRREERLNAGKLHIKAYDLNASHYDRYLKSDQQDDKKYENDLKGDKKDDAPQAIVDTFNQLNDTLKSLQKGTNGKGKETKSEASRNP